MRSPLERTQRLRLKNDSFLLQYPNVVPRTSQGIHEDLFSVLAMGWSRFYGGDRRCAVSNRILQPFGKPNNRVVEVDNVIISNHLRIIRQIEDVLYSLPDYVFSGGEYSFPFTCWQPAKGGLFCWLPTPCTLQVTPRMHQLAHLVNNVPYTPFWTGSNCI